MSRREMSRRGVDPEGSRASSRVCRTVVDVMPSGQTPLDSLLAVLKTPSLAADLSENAGLWGEVKRHADIHRLAGELAHRSSQWLPANERPWRDQVLMSHHRRHGQRLDALGRLAEAFRTEGLALVSLKGPLLAERFYPVPFLRPSNDLDLLIRKEDVGRAARLMMKLGFPLEGNYPWRLQYRVSHHLNFGATGNSPRVEIHYDLRAGRSRFESAGFMERSLPWTSPSGLCASVLEPADEAFYVCVHAAHHAFHRLRWLFDIAAIASGMTPAERSRTREMALRQGQAGVFVAADIAAREFLDEPLALDNSDLPAPWLWSRLRPSHVQKMVRRVEGNTSTLSEKIGYRMDVCRMAGNPLRAIGLAASWADEEIRKKFYTMLNSEDRAILGRTLPE